LPLGTVNPGSVNPWRGAYGAGEYYYPREGGDVDYDETTDGGLATLEPSPGPWNPAATLGAVNPGSVNPWRGAWNMGQSQVSAEPWPAAGRFGYHHRRCHRAYETYVDYVGMHPVEVCS
jgi:hypothetical protein